MDRQTERQKRMARMRTYLNGKIGTLKEIKKASWTLVSFTD
jgi:hypothetical protein